MKVAQAIVILFVMAGSVLILNPSVQANEMNEVPEKTYTGYNQVISEDIVQNQNMSFQGRPFAIDPRNGDIYLASGDHLLDVSKFNITTEEYTELFTGWTAGGVTDVIKCGLVMDNGYVFLSRVTNNTFFRSTDGGATFESNLVMQVGAFGWGMATDGADIYVGEYGVTAGSTAKVYASHDYGDTWAVAWESFDDLAPYTQHIHRIAIDPYTGDVYVTVGDGQVQLVRSTDGGMTFEAWGPQGRHTAIAFDQDNIYFGDDPKPKVYIYNRTTGTMTLKFLGVFGGTYPPVYDMAVGQHGVIYARTFDDAIGGNTAGIWASPNGYDWGMVVNLTYYSVDGNIFLHIGADEFVHYGTAFGPDYYNTWHWKFTDITQEEAWALVKQSEPRSSGASFSYEDGELAYNNSLAHASLQQDVIDDAVLAVEGVQNVNLFSNGMLDTVESLNLSWESVGWSHIEYFESQNSSWNFVSGAGHSGEYAIKAMSFNRSRTEQVGQLCLRSSIPTDLQQPAGTPLTFSYWSSSAYGNASSNLYGGQLASGIYVKFSDLTAVSTTFDGSTTAYGPGGGCWDEDDVSWGRRWVTWTPSATKQVTIVEIFWKLYGNYTQYIDDIQCQWGSSFTPAIAQHTMNVTSVDVKATVAGQEYEFGTLGHDEEASISLGLIAGLVAVDFAINGSECVNWSITGDRVASSYNALVDLEDDVIVATHLYDGAALEFWSLGAVDPSTFIDEATGSQHLSVAPTGGTANLTFTSWGSSLAWSCSTNATSVTYTVSGLSPTSGYVVFMDGAARMYQEPGSSTLTFVLTGDGDIEVLVWAPEADTTIPDPAPTETTPPTSEVAATSVSWTGIGFLSVACGTTILILALLMKRSRRSRGRSHG